jgi:RHH-type rel operon transcriptional repressor/antitoxin RelB
MNVRIDEKLKQAGDEALASIGMSPSQAVRLLWQRAAEHGEGLERVKALAQVAGSDSSEGERVNGIAEERAVLERGIAALELDKARPLTVNDEELLEEAALERLHERGLR